MVLNTQRTGAWTFEIVLGKLISALQSLAIVERMSIMEFSNCIQSFKDLTKAVVNMKFVMYLSTVQSNQNVPLIYECVSMGSIWASFVRFVWLDKQEHQLLFKG